MLPNEVLLEPYLSIVPLFYEHDCLVSQTVLWPLIKYLKERGI